MPTDLSAIKNELNKVRVDHGVALNQYEATMVTIKDRFGFTTLEEVENEIKILRTAIPKNENHRDAMLAEAQGILQRVGMEDSNGTTKENNIQGRKPLATNETVAKVGVRTGRGTVPAKRTPRGRQIR